MKNNNIKTSIVFFMIAILSISCSKKDDIKPNKEKELTVDNIATRFINDGMGLLYYWNDEVKYVEDSRNITLSPKEYFYSILSKADKEHQWSFITDDIKGLLARFSGTQKDFGYSINLLWKDKDRNALVAFVRYVFPDSPAEKAGLKRGYIITKIDDNNITKDNYKKLFGNNGIKIDFQTNDNISVKKTADISPVEMEHNPVLKERIYEIDGKKIAYLFYTSYTNNFNYKIREAFRKFKAANVSDLILDLRYNTGGSVQSALYLSSMIVPQNIAQKKSPFVQMRYNKSIMKGLKGITMWHLTDTLMDGNLNLKKVYIIASGNSYSASELTIHALKPYTEVIHIGDTTGGKYTASWTVHPYNKEYGYALYKEQKEEIKNWAMQPIVAIYTDHNDHSFENPGFLVPNYQFDFDRIEANPTNLKPIGSTDDFLISKAISLITGNAYVNPSSTTRANKSEVSKYINSGISSASEDPLKEAVLIPYPNSMRK